MPMCFAVGCSHRSVRDTCSLYTFPKDKKKHALWTRLCRRADRDPGTDARLCSCHFVDGKKENGPSLFAYNERSRLPCRPPPSKRLMKWRTNIEMKNKPRKDKFLRSCHFQIECFTDSSKRRLLPEAVPTIQGPGMMKEVSYKCLPFSESKNIFPKDENGRQAYVEAVGGGDLAPSAHTVICSEHLKDTDFDRRSPVVTHIKESAIPLSTNENYDNLQMNAKHPDIDSDDDNDDGSLQYIDNNSAVMTDVTACSKDSGKMTNTSRNSDKFSVTLSTAQSLDVTWKISDYFSLPEVKDYTLDSPPFIFANATWCIRWYPYAKFGALVRLHSLVSCHKIIKQLHIRLGENSDFHDACHGYKTISYEENSQPVDYLGRIESDSVESVKEFAADTTLALRLHLLSEETTTNVKIIKNCNVDCSMICDGRDKLKTPDSLHVMPSNAQSFKIKWKIPEYFSFLNTTGCYLNSPPFNFDSATWCLKLYPNGSEDSSKIKLYIVRSHSSVSCHKLICRCDLTVDDKMFYTNLVYERLCFDKNEECEFVDSIKNIPERSVLIKAIQRKVIPDGIVGLLCHIFIEKSTESFA